MDKPGRKCRVGFLGTGYIASWHAEALRRVSGAVLAAVCDRDAARAQAFAAEHGVGRAFASVDEMLGDRELGLDAVHVLLPPDLHARAAATLIDAGLHVLLEKPMGVTPGECAELIERASARGVRLGVGHNFLFAEPYERLRADLAAGVLGRPDRITVSWHRPLEQAQSGPFDIWMLRDPRNVLLEVGPHAAAPLFDLMGALPLLSSRASNPITLPGGVTFYRRWQIDAGTDDASATISLSLGRGFSEFTIHVRGDLASATVDVDRDTYVLHQHTRYGIDFDRYRMLMTEGASLRSQARRTLRRYALSKFKLSNQGNPYGASVAKAVAAFHKGLNGPQDQRVSAELGREIVAFCVEAGRASGVAPSLASPAPAAVSTAVQAVDSADVLVLGATGFIGQALVRKLLDLGRPVRILARSPGRLPDDLRRPEVEVVVGDLRRLEDLDRALEGVRRVYHLARPIVKTWDDFVAQDIEVTRRVAEACLARGITRLIYTGTIDSYYDGVKAGTITESTGLDPQIGWRNYYAQAKAASEGILEEMRQTRGLPVVILRPGIVIGTGGSPFHWGVGMWSYNAVCQVWGRGDNPLPLVLVDDVADALVAALDVPGIEGESFNLIADSGVTALGYLKALEEALGAKLQVIPTSPWRFYANDLLKWVVKRVVRHPDRRRPSYRDWETRTHRGRYDCAKARAVLRWKPVDDPAEMIRQGITVPAAEILARAGQAREQLAEKPAMS